MNFSEYSGRRVVVTGCSSGIGLALVTRLVGLGADVVGLSRRRPEIALGAFIAVDLASAESVDDAAQRIEGPIDALFNCAGAPPTVSSLDLVKINFLGPRLLTEHLVERMQPGSAIANVSSSVASAWRSNIARLKEFTANEKFAQGASWYESHEDVAGHGYPFSKEALTVWSMEQSEVLIAGGIRVNIMSPGAVQTPLMEASETIFPAEYLAVTERPIGRRSRVDEQVEPLLFLNSDSASYINGADLATDGGYSAVRSLVGSQW